MTKRDKYLRKTYGVTEKEYKAKLKAQGGRCALCPKKQKDLTYSLHQDHNHKTGVNRGLLCYRCNKFIVGRHNLETATKLYNYMVQHESLMPEPQRLDPITSPIPD